MSDINAFAAESNKVAGENIQEENKTITQIKKMFKSLDYEEQLELLKWGGIYLHEKKHLK